MQSLVGIAMIKLHILFLANPALIHKSCNPSLINTALSTKILRKKMAEQDAAGEDPRLILSVEEITDMVRVFLPASGNEARMMDRINTHLNKIADLGFIRRLKGQKDKIEVIRILKAFVDAQWLSELDDRLKQYQDHLSDDTDTGPAGGSDMETKKGSSLTRDGGGG